MIETWCSCGQPLTAQESDVHQPAQCSKCAAAARFICAEDLPDGANVYFSSNLPLLPLRPSP